MKYKDLYCATVDITDLIEFEPLLSQRYKLIVSDALKKMKIPL